MKAPPPSERKTPHSLNQTHSQSLPVLTRYIMASLLLFYRTRLGTFETVTLGTVHLNIDSCVLCRANKQTEQEHKK